MSDEILAVVEASAIRRWLGIGMLVALGGMSCYVAFATPPEPAWQGFLIGVGLLALWVAERLRRATASRLELTRDALHDSSGAVLARVADVVTVDRGMMAFKPSNGFVVTTRAPGPRGWRPGLWWRLGRRIGVGGVASAHQTKAMAELLSAMVAERKGQAD